MAIVAAVIAVILFALAAFGVRWESVEILPLGLTFLALALILPGGFPVSVKSVRKE